MTVLGGVLFFLEPDLMFWPGGGKVGSKVVNLPWPGRLALTLKKMVQKQIVSFIFSVVLRTAHK